MVWREKGLEDVQGPLVGVPGGAQFAQVTEHDAEVVEGLGHTGAVGAEALSGLLDRQRAFVQTAGADQSFTTEHLAEVVEGAGDLGVVGPNAVSLVRRARSDRAGRPRPGNPGPEPGGPCGLVTASSSARRASSSAIPNRSRYISGRSSAGTFSAGTSSTRTGTSLPWPAPGTAIAAAHSAAVYRDGSKYATENSATSRSHRSSASLIAVTKFWPAAQSHTSSSTAYPASLSCQATHSAHARSAPA
jgi:hypothetical protein